MYSCVNMTFSALSSKEVICIADGTRLGYIGDLEFDGTNGRIAAYLLPSNRFFNFSRKMCYRVCREWVEKIGEDLILVCRYERLEKDGAKAK